MGGCTAQFCNNSSKKGYSMKLFPTNPERRALWIKNVGYKSHLIGKNSCLCEMHFALDMWEQRVDGMKKLKPNAVPTIFGFFLKKKISVAESANDEVLTKDNDVSDDMKIYMCNIKLLTLQ
ncbi:THAP domain-containing protein 2 [Trachymyrmex cornetzi]|uniref:THAP domain-containing protein 2 n=1 Tax=Trachymyrmex cornetzi TaxID=471704 RepID=A0A151K2Q9_9HYME|nr:THAP domain-containing protein 2 [Trachymyrmex cornetzi]